MSKSLDASDITVIRPGGLPAPTDYSTGAADDNDHWNFGGHDDSDAPDHHGH